MKYDVVIVGAGPGGLRCAEILATNDKKVLVLEKGSVIGDKVCAGGLTLKDLSLGMPDKIIQRKFKTALVTTPFQKTRMELDSPFVATLDRKDLGKWMANKAKKAGAEIQTQTEVTAIEKSKVLVNNQKIKFKYLVGADGSTSIVRKSLGLKTENFLQAIQYITNKKFKDIQLFVNPDKYGGAYLWIFPYKDSTSVGTGFDLSRKIKQPVFNLNHKIIKKNFDKWCDKRFNRSKAEFQAFIINYDYQGHEFGNKFLIGDAGGFASGLTGEGIYNAIKSGGDVANKIVLKKYSYPEIRHILYIKRIEEMLLRSLEINKTVMKAEWELLNLLFKTKWGDEIAAKSI
ncbi:MAG: NAD(P)/FAD-dependent oxidoreductase [archaeon]